MNTKLSTLVLAAVTAMASQSVLAQTAPVQSGAGATTNVVSATSTGAGAATAGAVGGIATSTIVVGAVVAGAVVAVANDNNTTGTTGTTK